VATLVVILAAQANVAATREADAQASTARMRHALQYISHEARAPLGGAILSMGLLDDAIAVLDVGQANLLVTDLHLSLEAAQRQLTDLLVFDNDNPSEADQGAGWKWARVDGPHLTRLRSSFAGACQAEGIILDIRVRSLFHDPKPVTDTVADCLEADPTADEAVAAAMAEASDSKETSGARGHQSSLHSGGDLTFAPSKPGDPATGGDVRSGSTMVLSEDAAVPAELFIDVERALAIVQNALSNSIKHAPGRGTGKITVSLTLGPEADLDGHEPSRKPNRTKRGGSVSKHQPAAPGVGSTPHSTGRTRQAPVGKPPQMSSVFGRTGTQTRGVSAAPPVRQSQTGPRTSARSVERRTMGRRVLWIEVLDNGNGIPSDMLQPGRLFRPFQQLRQGDGSPRMTSSGLGLSIVKSVVVEQLHGVVGLASKEGQGTLFVAKVPVWAREADLEPEADPTSTAPPITAAGSLSQPAATLRSLTAVPERRGSDSGAGGGSPMASPMAMVEQDSGADTTEDGALPIVSSHREAASSVSSHDARGQMRGKRVDSFRTGSPTLTGGRAVGGAADLVTAVASGKDRTRKERATRREARRQDRETRRSAAGSTSDGSSGMGGPAVLAAGTAPPDVTPMLAYVVDDERVNRTLMSRLLHSWGFRVTGMDDGIGFIDEVERLVAAERRGEEAVQWPSVVTLDIQMPGMDGFASLRRLAAMAQELTEDGAADLAAKVSQLVVIGVTGNAVLSDRERMLKLGARRVLTKPVDPPELASQIELFAGMRLPPRAHRRLGVAAS